MPAQPRLPVPKKKTNPKRIAILLGVLVSIAVGGAAGFTYWEQKQHLAERDRAEIEARAAVERRRADEISRIVSTVRLAADHAVPRQEVNQRNAQLLQLVKQTKSQYIVFPPSAPMSRPSLDITARIAIARQLARMIEAETQTAVPDPALVYEAYGAPRRIMPENVPGYLMDSHIQWVITGIASHDADGRMMVQLMKLPVKAAPPPINPRFERSAIEISDEVPPEAAFRPLASEALHALGFVAAPIELMKEEAPAQLNLAASPMEAEKQQQSVTEGLWLQQLIGVLHHSLDYMDPRPRERVFERVAAAINDLSPESGDYRMLSARTQLYLGRPAAAAKALTGAPGTPEVKALLAYIKSDLPALKAAVPAIERQVPRLIAECELIHLRADFRDLSQDAMRAETERLMQAVPDGWQHLFALLIAHQSEWSMPSPAQLKPILDRDFPVQGYRVDDIVRGKEALGGSPTDEKTAAEFMVSPLIHAAKWREGNAAALCCEQRNSSWRQFDRVQYLDLMEALAAGELAGHLQFLTQVQGKPEAALHEADLYDQVYFHGLDPQIMAARIHAMDSVEASAAGSGNTRALHAQKVELAKKILSWQSAQTEATADAVFLDAQHGIRDGPQPRGVHIQIQDADASLFDFPRRPVWSNRVAPAIRDDSLRLAVQRTACRDIVGHVWMCTAYLERLREKMGQQMYRNEIAQLIEPRFAGSAARATFLADVKVEVGDFAGAETLLKESIAAEPGQMGLYAALGALQLRDGRYEEAARSYLSYPGLKAKSENTVELSNYLEPAAREFLEHGAVAQARQLFSIVAGYHDGSYDNLSAVVQLALMDGRYDLARDTLQSQYRRYQQQDTGRKLVALLFMMGKSQEAWSALQGSGAYGDPYHVSIVGLRMANADAARIASWSAASADHVNNYWQPFWGAFFNLTLDRPASSVRAIYEVDAQARGAMKTFQVKEPLLSELKGAASNDTYFPHPAFIEGYAAVKERDYAKAAAALQSVYQSDKPAEPAYARAKGQWALLPYFALAAAKSGEDAVALDQRLRAEDVGSASQKHGPGGTHAVSEFHHHLVLAIGHAFKGNHAEAQAEVKRAQATIDSGGLLEARYVFVEILERLSEETRQPAYLDAALEYARAYQRLEPWTSWAYAFEARHAPAGPARVRAAGIALKLDPQSQWLREIDQQTLQQARQWAGANRWPGKDSPSTRAKSNQA